MSFDGKVVLITGGSSGIGAGAACHLAKLGAQVSIIGRNKDRLNETVAKIKNLNAPKPLAIVADVTKDAERIVDETIKHFGKLDVLINNAGIAKSDDILSHDTRTFDNIFDTNLRSVIRITQLCVPHLEKTKGNIVNVSSIVGLMSYQNQLTYGMSKAALDKFTKCCALDLAPKKIRVNSINPGTIRTPMLAPRIDTVNILKEFFPIPRVGEVSDTNEAIAFLANDQTASFLTGILLPVDGRFLISGPSTNFNK